MNIVNSMNRVCNMCYASYMDGVSYNNWDSYIHGAGYKNGANNKCLILVAPVTRFMQGIRVSGWV